MAARKPTNLVRRGDVFYFRTAIPSAVRKSFSRLEFKVSLRTTNLEQAKLRQRWISFLWENITQALSTMAIASSVRIDQVVRRYFSEEVDNLVLHATEGPRHPSFEMEAEIADASQFLVNLRARIGSRQYTELDVYQAVDLLKKSDLEIPPKGSDTLDDVCNKTLRARAEAVRIFLALLQGRHDEAVPKDSLFAGESTSTPTINGQWQEQRKSVGELAATYVEEHRKIWGPKTVLDKTRVNNLFLKIADPATPISDITPDMVREFKSKLTALPANLVKYKDLRDLPLHQAIKKGEERGLPKLSGRTAEKYMEMLKTFFEWACNEQYLSTNPAGRIAVPYDRSKAERPRNSYHIDQLNQLFASPLYVGHKSKARRHLPGTIHTRDGRFWIPLVALFSGMRAGEIIQLQIQDIRQVEEWWVFDINKGDDGKKAVKTTSSVRQVPVHPTLIELGFLDFVAEKKKSFGATERLFEEIELGKHGDPSHDFSKRYSRYTKHVSVKTAKTTFHSFRHSFVDALRAAAVPEYVFEALTGHSRGKVSGTYGSAGTPMKLKADAIAAIKYPGLKIEHLVG